MPESSGFRWPLRLQLQRSWQMTLVLLVMHIGAVVCLLPTTLPPLLKVLAGLAVTGHFLFTNRHHALHRGSQSVTEFSYTEMGKLELWTRDGSQVQAVLIPGSYLHPLLGVLRYRVVPWRCQSVVWLSDGLEQEMARRLRVRLRWPDRPKTAMPEVPSAQTPPA